MTLLVILHIPCEPPAPTTTSRARGDEPHRVEIGEEGVLPDWRRLDRVVAIAGPTGAHPS